MSRQLTGRIAQVGPQLLAVNWPEASRDLCHSIGYFWLPHIGKVGNY